MNNRAIIPRSGWRAGWRTLLLVLTGLLLGACSTSRLAYNQAPGLAFWWFDAQVDLTDAQSTQVRADLERFFEWHRRNELPVYADTLQRWQTLAGNDITAAQACTEFDRIRERVDTATERGLEPLARLALQLQPAQLQHLKEKQAKGNQEFNDNFLQDTQQARHARRVEKAAERSERLYGRLTEAQRQLLLRYVSASPFDPERFATERLRNQADLRQTIAQAQALQGAQAVARPAAGVISQAQASPAPLDSVLPLLRGYAQRLWQSPLPGYSAYSSLVRQHGCAQFAALHNSTSPEQREQARQALKGYESDLRALAEQAP